MNVKYALFLCTLLFSQNWLFAQEIWTIERCVAYALENNLQIEQGKLNLESARVNRTQSKGQFLPTVNAQATHFYNYGQTIDPFTNTFAQGWVQSNNLALNANWALFQGMQNINNYRQNQYAYLASQYGLKAIEYNVTMMVIQAYLQVLFSTENLKITNVQLELTAEQVKRTKSLVDNGSAPISTLLDIEAQFAREELNNVDAENAYNLSVLSLKQLMLLPSETEMRLENPGEIDVEQILLPNSTQSVVEKAYAFYPTIKQSEYNVLSSKKGIHSAKGAFSPSLNLTGRLGTGYSGNQSVISGVRQNPDEVIGFVDGTNQAVLRPSFSPVTDRKPYNQQFEDNLNRTIGFSLSIPIFNGFTLSSNVSRAKINYELAENSLNQEKLTLRQEVEKTYNDALAAQKRYDAGKKALRASQLAFENAEKRFQVGVINPLDYNTAKTNLARAQADLIRAKYEYLFTSRILQLYQGDAFKP